MWIGSAYPIYVFKPADAMDCEILAVVDEHDEIIDYRPRNEIHTLNLRHRAVHILVFNEQKQLFLQKRSQNKDTNPGLWDTSAAGHVDKGEDYAQCAIREIEEELGVKPKAALKALFKLAPTAELGMEFIQVFCCYHSGPFQLAADEIEDGAWFNNEQVNQRVAADDPTLTQTFKTIWKHLPAPLHD